jgi:hypothetical protein
MCNLRTVRGIRLSASCRFGAVRRAFPHASLEQMFQH